MDAVHVIKRPIVTEKSTFAMNERKQYSFLVDPRASKGEIKRAVEEAYKVRVVGVTTQVRKGKWRRMRYGLVQEPLTKKATVRVHPDDTIDLI
jgi:large subunit ribosomal protein L23